MASGRSAVRIGIWSRQGTGSMQNQVIKRAYLLSPTFPDEFLVVFPYILTPQEHGLGSGRQSSLTTLRRPVAGACHAALIRERTWRGSTLTPGPMVEDIEIDFR